MLTWTYVSDSSDLTPVSSLSFFILTGLTSSSSSSSASTFLRLEPALPGVLVVVFLRPPGVLGGTAPEAPSPLSALPAPPFLSSLRRSF